MVIICWGMGILWQKQPLFPYLCRRQLPQPLKCELRAFHRTRACLFSVPGGWLVHAGEWEHRYTPHPPHQSQHQSPSLVGAGCPGEYWNAVKMRVSKREENFGLRQVLDSLVRAFFQIVKFHQNIKCIQTVLRKNSFMSKKCPGEERKTIPQSGR